MTTQPTLHRVFVYGSLRKNQYNHSNNFAKGATHIADGYITRAELVSLGAYPAIIPTEDSNQCVIGEVYDLDEHTFEWIERMELGAGYRRDQVLVFYETIDRNYNGDGNPLEADAYFYANPARLDGAERVDDGDWSAFQERERELLTEDFPINDDSDDELSGLN